MLDGGWRASVSVSHILPLPDFLGTDAPTLTTKITTGTSESDTDAPTTISSWIHTTSWA
jgi:hypothetical protein